jgi:peptidoglycan hydrolase CwlO-like protein
MGKKILAFLLVLILLLVPGAVIADECADKSVEEKVGCYEAKLQENLGKQKTLANTISYLDNKISLKRAEIGQTEEDIASVEEEIVTLSVKIGRLDVSLNDVSELLISRVGASYKRSLFKPIMMLFSSKGLTDFFERNKYLQTIQLNDRKILLELQTSRDVHQEQKDLKQKKQEELEGLKAQLSAQRVALGGQKQEKQNLLNVTKNDESRYQQLLAAARSAQQAQALSLFFQDCKSYVT